MNLVLIYLKQESVHDFVVARAASYMCLYLELR